MNEKDDIVCKITCGNYDGIFLNGGGVSCSDGSDKDNTPETKYYTVTFESNGGSDVPSQTVEAGKTATKPDAPTKEDVPFLNWLKDGKPFSFSTPIMADITLTAQWGTPGAIIYTITFDNDGGTAIDPQNVESGKTAGEPPTPTKEGYAFLGWYNGDTEFDFSKPITADIALTAKWEAVTTKPGDDKEPGDNGDEPSSEWTGPSSPIESGTAQQKPSEGTNTNAEVEIVKSEGLLNSAYVIFKQIDGTAAYEVTVDGTEIDEQLIRYYDEYVWYEPNEASDLSVTWKKNSYSKVVRADALGLKAGEHTIKVAVKGSEKYSTATMKVLDHDRSGFAFTGAKTPGAYNKDGTLKSGAVVIYLTQANKKTVTATIGGTSYTGIQAITQAIKTKNTKGTAVDIRVIGMVKAEGNDLSCDDHKSSYALGVKEASEVTIEGVGHDATLYGAGVAAFKCDYIEIANLGLMKWGGGKDGDGIALKGGGAGYIWVHNNDVFYGDAGSDGDQVKGDGSMDLKDNTKYVTIAYNHFWDSGKMSLCGMKSESGPNYITYHHNWFDHSDSRHPRIRTMTVHVYNNYFDGNAKYGVGVTTGASCFVEGNFFRNAHNPMMSSKQGTDAQGSGTFSGEKGGVIKSWNNAFEQSNTNGVKFQFITNKYDYTNNRELGEYKEWTDTVGTNNGDGTWTIYDSTASPDTIATNSLIAIEDASNKGGYYQISKGKTGFYIDVPKDVQKVVVTAKCGSSGQSGTANMLSVNGKSVSMNMADNFKDYEVAVTVSSDSTIEIANVHSKNSMNVREIKVIAASGWETTLTSGADPKNIDAYEVDARSQRVPDEVRTRSGDTTYSNFDTVMGNAGLGLSADPTGPQAAKTDVLNFSGRHNSDFAHDFSNATDDASYAKNDALNNALLNYKTGFKGIQGTTTGGEVGGEPVNPSNPSLALDKTELLIAEGGTGKIKATLKDTTGTLSCESSDVNIATVTLSNNEATVTGVKAGKATITFKVGDLTGTCNVEVKAGFDPTTITTAVTTGEYSIGTNDKVFSKQDDGAVQTHNNITVTCKIDSNGANVYAKSSKTPGGVFFKLDSGMTLSFTNKDGDAVTTGFEIFSIDTNKNETKVTGTTLDAGTYVIRGTSTSATKICKIKFEATQTGN